MASAGQVFKYKVEIEKKAGELEVEYEKKVGLTRTLISAMACQPFFCVMAWVGGDDYEPVMNCMIKNEPKKFRKLVNADMVTFTKQSYIYGWLMSSIAPDVKKKFYYYLDTKERLERMERISRMCKNEKWACPLDLRDFHVQFGAKQHERLIDALMRRTKSVKDPNIRKEIEHLLTELRKELTFGTAEFTCLLPGRDNNFDTVFAQQRLNDPFFREAVGLKKINYESEYLSDQDKSKSSFEFKVSNGILSGWKLTSLMGSTYNLTLSSFLSYFGFNLFKLYPSDLVIQGDDTHFKTRFLSHALFHFSAVNAIGKDAHPKKQFISSRYTEFLKTVYDMKKRCNNYSPARMITSLCYEKSNRPVRTERNGWFKDIVDTWNLFLIRIPDESRRNFIVNKGYPSLSVKTRFKLQGLSPADISELLSNPPRLGQYLLGPITSKHSLINKNGEIKKDRGWMRAIVKNFTPIYEMQRIPGDRWTGVNYLVQGMIK